jgi:hypothetical protein
MQYIGRLMRDTDPRADPPARSGGTRRCRVLVWWQSRWRERLLADSTALDQPCAAARTPTAHAFRRGGARAGRASACRTAACISRALSRSEHLVVHGARDVMPAAERALAGTCR